MGDCSALPQLEIDGLSQGTMGHPQSRIKEKSYPPRCLGLERVVQSISPCDKADLYPHRLETDSHWI